MSITVLPLLPHLPEDLGNGVHAADEHLETWLGSCEQNLRITGGSRHKTLIPGPWRPLADMVAAVYAIAFRWRGCKSQLFNFVQIKDILSMAIALGAIYSRFLQTLHLRHPAPKFLYKHSAGLSWLAYRWEASMWHESTQRGLSIGCHLVYMLHSIGMDGRKFHGWRAPLVVRSNDEMYGRILWKFLPSMDGRYPWGNATYLPSSNMQMLM